MKEPQDRVQYSKQCCTMCHPNGFFKIGKRRVRRAWKDYLKGERKYA